MPCVRRLNMQASFRVPRHLCSVYNKTPPSQNLRRIQKLAREYTQKRFTRNTEPVAGVILPLLTLYTLYKPISCHYLSLCMVVLPMLMTKPDAQMLTTTSVNNRGTLHKIVRGITQPIPYGIRNLFYGHVTKGVFTSWHNKSSEDSTSSPSSGTVLPLSTANHKPELQTKHIKVITRQDIINGKYDLDGSKKDSTSTHDKRKRPRRRHTKRDGSRQSMGHSSHETSTLPTEDRIRSSSQPPLITIEDTSDGADAIEPLNSTSFRQVDDAFLLTLHLHKQLSRESGISGTSSV